jgi:AcrR family transcriptional regulator
MSPRTSTQYAEIREEKRTLIMDVALEHFAGVGFHATTIDHIARHAGISKGLMYNYFKSKEDLLSQLISRSVNEIFQHFDEDRDGFLSENEFEHFLVKLTESLGKRRLIWRLFFQMMMQKEVREKIMPVSSASVSPAGDEPVPFEIEFIPQILKMISDYFERKRAQKEPSYDPGLEMELFLIHLKGIAMTYIYSDDLDEKSFKRVVNRIIEIYK